ncbi:hypothetical protein ACFL2B_02385 [Patescibacteria group bacterium]
MSKKKNRKKHKFDESKLDDNVTDSDVMEDNDSDNSEVKNEDSGDDQDKKHLFENEALDTQPSRKGRILSTVIVIVVAVIVIWVFASDEEPENGDDTAEAAEETKAEEQVAEEEATEEEEEAEEVAAVEEADAEVEAEALAAADEADIESQEALADEEESDAAAEEEEEEDKSAEQEEEMADNKRDFAETATTATEALYSDVFDAQLALDEEKEEIITRLADAAEPDKLVAIDDIEAKLGETKRELETARTTAATSIDEMQTTVANQEGDLSIISEAIGKAEADIESLSLDISTQISTARDSFSAEATTIADSTLTEATPTDTEEELVEEEGEVAGIEDESTTEPAAEEEEAAEEDNTTDTLEEIFTEAAAEEEEADAEPEPELIEEELEQEEAVEEETILDEEAIIEEEPVVEETPEVEITAGDDYALTASQGDSLTTASRKIIGQAMENGDISAELSSEQRVYMEDYLQNSLGHRRLSIGEDVTFSRDLMQQAAEKALSLSDKQLENLKQYSSRVTF